MTTMRGEYLLKASCKHRKGPAMGACGVCFGAMYQQLLAAEEKLQEACGLALLLGQHMANAAINAAEKPL